MENPKKVGESIKTHPHDTQRSVLIALDNPNHCRT